MNFDSLKDRYIYVVYENIIAARANEISLEYTDYGKTLDLMSLD